MALTQTQTSAPLAPNKPSVLKKIGLGILKVVLFPLAVFVGSQED